jgi:hypothetical protein
MRVVLRPVPLICPPILNQLVFLRLCFIVLSLVPCTTHDPRCTVCDAKQCLRCDDVLLKSIRRSGQRMQDADLPFDELRRELSDWNHHMTQSRFAFDEAEMYYVVNEVDHLEAAGFKRSTAAGTLETYVYLNGSIAPPADGDPTAVDLRDLAVICHQGLLNPDASWYCYPYPVSHRVCGHPGMFSFSSPTYSIWEDNIHLRVTVVRSGGGLGRATVKYNLIHNTTNTSDVTPTAHYTSTQVLAL